jgi:hypothetical protein
MIGKFICGFAASVIVMASPAIADPLIIKFEGASAQQFKPGKKLVPGSSIQLRAGEMLTVLDERGTRVLRGPGTFSASSAASAGKVSAKSLVSIMKTSNVRRARTGAVRGTPTGSNIVRRSPNLWYVDITNSGSICVADFGKMQFWRSDTAEALSLRLQDDKSANAAMLNFPKGISSAAWPADVAPVAGGSYTILRNGGSSETVKLVAMPVAADEQIVDIAARLLDRGCQTQAELLAESFAQAERPTMGG